MIDSSSSSANCSIRSRWSASLFALADSSSRGACVFCVDSASSTPVADVTASVGALCCCCMTAGSVDIVAARLCYVLLPGLKNVSILYFLTMEHRWTDKPTMPGTESSSSMLKFSSKLKALLSRPPPETIDAYIACILRFETRFWVMTLLNLFKVDRR